MRKKAANKPKKLTKENKTKKDKEIQEIKYLILFVFQLLAYFLRQPSQHLYLLNIYLNLWLRIPKSNQPTSVICCLFKINVETFLNFQLKNFH